MGAYVMKVLFQTSCISSAMFITAMAANPLAVDLARDTLGATIRWADNSLGTSGIFASTGVWSSKVEVDLARNSLDAARHVRLSGSSQICSFSLAGNGPAEPTCHWTSLRGCPWRPQLGRRKLDHSAGLKLSCSAASKELTRLLPAAAAGASGRWRAWCQGWCAWSRCH